MFFQGAQTQMEVGLYGNCRWFISVRWCHAVGLMLDFAIGGLPLPRWKNASKATNLCFMSSTFPVRLGLSCKTALEDSSLRTKIISPLPKHASTEGVQFSSLLALEHSVSQNNNLHPQTTHVKDRSSPHIAGATPHF